MSEAVTVRRLHQILLWPLRLMPAAGGDAAPRRPWELLRANAGPWTAVADEYTGAPEQFHERHYQEFVAFLPFVQRFLYGEGRSGRDSGDSSGSCMKVFRRRDVTALRVQARPDMAPRTLDVIHIDLYFFEDVDVVLLNVEVASDELDLPEAQDLLYRLGRAYPSGWDANGRPVHTLLHAEWLDTAGTVLAASDSAEREPFIKHVHEHRAPRIAAHWDFLLRPLASEHSEEPGVLRYRQIETYRMPLMAYLAVDEPKALSRADCARLGLCSGDAAHPFTESALADFEADHCWDRYWCEGGSAPQTRYFCTGQTLVVLGRADAEFFRCRDRGVLAQFRHQHFMLFLIAHFQKASLLMFSDRLVEAVRRLDISDAESVKRFKRAIRASFESFLRFTHRYWFHAISDQAQTRALYALCVRHLELDPVYAEVKQRIGDLSGYLETDSLRRQANTVVRLTVVTILGLIGTITTGFLGMNLMAEADAPMSRRVWIFMATLAITIALTIYTMAKSKRLSDFLDALSDERLPWWAKLGAFVGIWWQPKRRDSR